MTSVCGEAKSFSAIKKKHSPLDAGLLLLRPPPPPFQAMSFLGCTVRVCSEPLRPGSGRQLGWHRGGGRGGAPFVERGPPFCGGGGTPPARPPSPSLPPTPPRRALQAARACGVVGMGSRASRAPEGEPRERKRTHKRRGRPSLLTPPQAAFTARAARPPVLAPPARPSLLTIDAKQGGGKLKTKKAASKRIKVTAGGKVMVRRAGKQHINEKLSSSKLSALSKEKRVPDCNLNLVIKCLPYAGISK